jgi:hypothetical protein
VALANVIFGSPTLAIGGLLFTSRAAGVRGQQNSITVTISGSSIVVATANAHTGIADILLTVPASTTEAALLNFLNASATFLALASVSQSSGDGSAFVAAHVLTHFSAAIDGLKQALQNALNLQAWDNRQLEATGGPVALLWPAQAQPERQQSTYGADDIWQGVIGAGVAFQHKSDFETEMVILDIFRRSLYLALKTFVHPDVEELGGPIKFDYENYLKPEGAGVTDGTTSQESRLRVVAAIPCKWTEPAFDPLTIAQNEWPFKEFDTGLYVEPLIINAWRLSLDCTSFTLTYASNSTVVMYSATVTVGVIQSNLEELASIGVGHVTVLQADDGDYLITLGSTLNPNVPITGFAMGGNARLSLTQQTRDAVPGDAQKVLDQQLTITGTI